MLNSHTLVAICATLELLNPVYSQDSSDLEKNWEALSSSEADEISLGHLRQIVWAIHAYVDDHKGKLPPVEVKNDALPPEKRLSGFVLLLPYMGVRPSSLPEDSEVWLRWKADASVAKSIYAKIDLTKAWDDPANAEAAKMLVPSLLLPSGAPVRDDEGNAVSHIAFVRGSARTDGKPFENGAFPRGKSDEGLAISQIGDGTSMTVAIGQIHDNLGPWMAAGSSTSRQLFHTSNQTDIPTFGGQHGPAAYFANCDGFPYFLDIAQTPSSQISMLARRDDGRASPDFEFRYKGITEWKEATQDQK